MSVDRIARILLVVPVFRISSLSYICICVCLCTSGEREKCNCQALLRGRDFKAQTKQRLMRERWRILPPVYLYVCVCVEELHVCKLTLLYTRIIACSFFFFSFFFHAQTLCLQRRRFFWYDGMRLTCVCMSLALQNYTCYEFRVRILVWMIFY